MSMSVCGSETSIIKTADFKGAWLQIEILLCSYTSRPPCRSIIYPFVGLHGYVFNFTACVSRKGGTAGS